MGYLRGAQPLLFLKRRLSSAEALAQASRREKINGEGGTATNEHPNVQNPLNYSVLEAYHTAILIKKMLNLNKEGIMSVLLEMGDVFLTRGHSFISRAIRFCTCSIGESRTKVNHVGLVVGTCDLKDAIVVEALSMVRRHRLWYQYGPPKEDLVVVYRATNLTPDEVKIIVSTAERQVGKKYGYLKIVVHFLDWLLLGAYVFRRLVPDN